MSTSLCLVTMNRPKILKQTVVAIQAHAQDPYELIIVDNGSTDLEQLQYLVELEATGIRVIRNETNLGLSVATNQGLSAAQYDVLIHLDDDALITVPGWNGHLERFMQTHPEVGLVAPGRQTMDTIVGPDYREGRWFLGMAWALRREVFDAIGGYDTQLLHQQECDMGLRVRLYGYKVVEVPFWTAVHNDFAQQSELSKARENVGTVQFHDKWCQYFRGRDVGWKTVPRYLMQHFPPDQEFFRRLTLPLGLNTAPESLNYLGLTYWKYVELRLDDAFMSTPEEESDRYEESEAKIINDWETLSGTTYQPYQWKRLPYDNRG